MSGGFGEIVRRLDVGIYLIQMPPKINYDVLINLRRYVGQEASKEMAQRIGIIYVYPDNSGKLDMPEFTTSDDAAFDKILEPTADIRYDYVVYVNISASAGVVRGGTRMFYKLVHRLFPTFGKECDFAESLEEAIGLMETWSKSGE